LVVICGLIDFLIWIKAKVEKSWKFLDSWNSKGCIYNTHSIPITPKDAYIIPNQSLELNQKPTKYSYNDCIVITFQ
jgi:hypothetical protein